MYDGMGYVSLKILQDATVSQANKFLKAANNFVSQGDITTLFKEQVNTLVTNLADYFKNFFMGTLEILKSVLYGVLYFSGGGKRQEIVSSQGNKEFTTNNGIVVNVDLTGNEALSLATMISALSVTEASMLTTLQLTNTKLGEANQILSTLGEMHGLSISTMNTFVNQLEQFIKNQATVNGALDARIQVNSQQIDKIKNSNEKLPYRQNDNRIRQTNYAFL